MSQENTMSNTEEDHHNTLAISQAKLCAQLHIGLEGLTILEAFNGIGFQTDQGHFGICMRDRGIDILLDGKPVWNSYDVGDEGVESLASWAEGRWEAEVRNRPRQNVHRRALDTAWRQVIRRLGGAQPVEEAP